VIAASVVDEPPRGRATTVAPGLIVLIAWRNLWRNPRRTGLSIGAIGFAVALLLFAMAQQAGNYTIMIDNATGLLDGHLQIQRRGFRDDPRIGNTIEGAAGRVEALRSVVGVAAVTPRISAFVLASSHDRSVGTQLLGVAPRGEQTLSSLPDMIEEGRYLNGGAEAFAGALLARNLGVTIGDEIVILGTAPSGGIAALVVTLVGTFSSGIADIDRGLLEVPLDTVSEAFELHDAAHTIVARATSVSRASAVAATLSKEVAHDEVVLEWNELIPGLEQAIELDRIFGQILFALVAAIVTISVFNGFVMTIFERTREFGTLLAIGMRASTVIGSLQMEACCLSAIGCAAGLVIGIPLVLWLERVGIPLGDAGEMMRAFHMADRMYPTLNADVVVKPMALMILCTQLACLLPALRVRRIQPVEALRDA